jgi:hypothetical protein
MPTPRQYQFDIDTKRYLNRVNTYRALNNLPDIQKSDAVDIDNFIIGLKDLGMWTNTLCWLMRDIHNVGIGTTLLSLGGIGQYNGTLVNGPTWGVNGITYDGVDDVISTQFTLGAVRVFCGVVGNMPTTGGKGNFLGGSVAAGQTLYWVNPRSGFGGEYRYGSSTAGNVAVIDNTTTGVHMWSVTGGDGINTRGYRSLTLLSTSSGVGVVPSPNQLNTGFLLGRLTGGYQGTAAFCFITHATPSSPDSFYALYKQTIGKGLGLP